MTLHFLLEFLLKTLLMLLWMNTKVWDFLWIILDFLARHYVKLFWLSGVLFALGTLMDMIESHKAKKTSQGGTDRGK